MQTIELSAGTIEYEDTGGGPRSRMATRVRRIRCFPLYWGGRWFN